MKKTLSIILTISLLAGCCSRENTDLITDPADYVSTLVGSLSEHSFSTGNTYPAIALPWGMNFWTPVTGTMGDGWAYRYDAHRIRGFEQTHQPSPWINDYGQFAIMPVRDASAADQESRASWFSHYFLFLVCILFIWTLIFILSFILLTLGFAYFTFSNFKSSRLGCLFEIFLIS